MTGFWSLGTEDQNFKAVISTFCSFFNDFGVHVPFQACDPFMHYNIFDSIMMITNDKPEGSWLTVVILNFKWG